MSEAPWFKFFPSKFLSDADVQGMTAEQIGWYCLMLMLSWTNTPKGYVTADQQVLSRCCHCADALYFNREASVVLKKFKTTEDGRWFYHPLMLEQAEKTSQLYEKKQKAGFASAAARQQVRQQVFNRCSTDVEQVSIEVEGRSRNIERDIAPENLDEMTEEIGHLHPANAHLKGKFLPENQKYEIAEAIQRDGTDLVRAGTENYRDAVQAWPKSEHRFITNPVKFYRESEYLKDPETWERTDGQQSKHGPHSFNPNRAGAGIVRAISNVSAAQTALQIIADRRAERGGHGGNPVGQPD